MWCLWVSGLSGLQYKLDIRWEDMEAGRGNESLDHNSGDVFACRGFDYSLELIDDRWLAKQPVQMETISLYPRQYPISCSWFPLPCFLGFPYDSFFRAFRIKDFFTKEEAEVLACLLKLIFVFVPVFNIFDDSSVRRLLSLTIRFVLSLRIIVEERKERRSEKRARREKECERRAKK